MFIFVYFLLFFVNLVTVGDKEKPALKSGIQLKYNINRPYHFLYAPNNIPLAASVDQQPMHDLFEFIKNGT